MALKIHLVHCGITHSGFGSAGQPGEPSLIHHGLAMVGAVARESGHRVSLTDLRACSGWEDFQRRLSQATPDVVGITLMSCDFDAGLRAAGLVRVEHPSAKVIVGGVHPSLMPEELVSRPEIDVVFQGECEVTLPSLLRDLEEGRPLPRTIRGEFPNLDQIPFAARDLFPGLEVPEVSLYFPLPFVTIITGRGCPYNCSFCQPAERLMFGKKVRHRSVDDVLQELRLLRDQTGFRSLMIHDDCLTANREWTFEFCRRFRAEGLKARFLCQSRADIICKHSDLIAEMRRIGLDCLMIGFESGSDRVLRFMRKGTTVEQNLEAARICRRLGVRIWANYMLGIPTETKEEVQETVNMLRKIRPDFCSAAYYTPHPGSDLFTYCQEKDLSLIQSHGDYTRYPGEPKIKGVDYEFIEQRLLESFGTRRYHLIDRLGRAARRVRIPTAVRRVAKRLVVH